MGRRTVLLISSFLVAALGTTLIFLYVQGVNDRAIADQKPVQVLVAKSDIPVGTTVQAAQSGGMLEQKTIPRDAAALNAVADVSGLTGKVALSTIFTGQQIIAANFGDARATTGLTIPEGKIAASFQLSDPARVAGFVAPGSKVAIFVTITGPAGAAGAPAAGATFTRVLLTNVQVLAVGPTTAAPAPADGSVAAGANPETVPRAILTLALDAQETSKLVFASQQGQLYFGLLGEKSKLTPGAPIDLTNLFS